MFEWTNVDGVVVVKPAGELDINNAFPFRKWVKDNFAGREEYKAIIVDLSDIKSIDSFALGSLIALYKDANMNNKNFYLVVTNNDVNRVLEITSLNKVFPIVRDVKEAFKRLNVRGAPNEKDRF